MKYWLYLLLSVIPSAYAMNYPVKVGDTLVFIKVENKGPGKNFVHLHQNETTALKAARTVMKAKGGSVLTLIHNGQRNIIFYLHDIRYEFDPNRIFTDQGIKKTLSQFGAYSSAAHHEVKKLAQKIKEVLPKGKIIAVHNNKEYSLKNYLPGHDMEAEAQELHYLKKNNHRNFYLVTKKADFYRLKELAFNSVLQAKSASDDGSLSIYLAKRDYINVEAGYNQLAAQIKMLDNA